MRVCSHLAPIIAGFFSVLTLPACLTPDQPIPPFIEPTDGGRTPIFVDTILSETQSGVAKSCLPSGSACDAMGPCDPHPVRGPNDGNSFTMNPLDVLQVGFRCGVLIQHGSLPNAIGTTTDFKIWSTIPSGGQADIEVSYDDVQWSVLPLLTQSNQEFDLEVGLPILEMGRYIRITNVGSVAIQIDAIEGL